MSHPSATLLIRVLALSLVAGSAHAACITPPSNSNWLVKVEHLSTYPAGPEWNTTLTVHDDGCLVIEAPTQLRVGGGRTEWDLPAAHIDGLRDALMGEKLHTLRVDSLVTELKSTGQPDLRRFGADSVTDAPITVVQFRDPRSGAVSEALKVQALGALTLPKSMTRLRTVQDVVQTLEQLGRDAVAAREYVAPEIEGRASVQER